jgi:hypothetical protein
VIFKAAASALSFHAGVDWHEKFRSFALQFFSVSFLVCACADGFRVDPITSYSFFSFCGSCFQESHLTCAFHHRATVKGV